MALRVSLLSAVEDRAWAQLLDRHPLARAILPAWERLWGWAPVRFGVFSAGELVGGLELGVRKVPGAPISFGRVSLGMIGPDEAPAMLAALLGEVHRYAKEHRILEVELRLRIPVHEALPEFAYQAELWPLLAGLGYRPSRVLEHTYLVRVDRDDDEILRSFNEATRRHIAKAERAGLTVESETDPSALALFADAYHEMVERKHAPPLGDRELRDALVRELSSGHLWLLAGRAGGITSNMTIVERVGMPLYALGARSRANLSEAVPASGHLLQLDAMRRTRNLGKRWYDLGGAEGPEPIPGHPNYGVWRFKHGFRPLFVDLLPSFRRATFPRLGRIVGLAHALRGDLPY